jgi:hypothetical protein
MANAVVLMQPSEEAHDETLAADAFLDPSTAAVAPKGVTNPTEKYFPRFKDQSRTVDAPVPSTALDDQSAAVQQQQQQQQLPVLRDPPACEQQRQLPSYKDQVGL